MQKIRFKFVKDWEDVKEALFLLSKELFEHIFKVIFSLEKIKFQVFNLLNSFYLFVSD